MTAQTPDAPPAIRTQGLTRRYGHEKSLRRGLFARGGGLGNEPICRELPESG
jgi:hypothetical protein